MTLLSILIPTVPKRIGKYTELLKHLLKQTSERQDVEILGLFDNRHSPLGDKRNDLITMSQGKYFVFIDDDDWVTDDYVQRVCSMLMHSQAELDLLIYDVLYTSTDPQFPEKMRCRYEPRWMTGVVTYNGTDVTRVGPAAHTHVWRKALVEDIKFPSKSWQEDYAWTEVALGRVHTSFLIPEMLYFYRDDPANSETRY
jgi:glycosyltransferase involved in cell wall biosynthesis